MTDRGRGFISTRWRDMIASYTWMEMIWCFNHPTTPPSWPLTCKLDLSLALCSRVGSFIAACIGSSTFEKANSVVQSKPSPNENNNTFGRHIHSRLQALASWTALPYWRIYPPWTAVGSAPTARRRSLSKSSFCVKGESSWCPKENLTWRFRA